MIMNDWIKIWLEEYKRPFVKSSTLELIRYCLVHIQGRFGNVDMFSIKGFEIQQFINSLSDIGNMQDKCRMYLNDILEYASRNDFIAKNPMLACKFKKHSYENTTPMTLDVRNYFIDTLRGKSYELLYLTYLYSGARKGEVIRANSFVPDKHNKLLYIHGTKNEVSDRVIPLFDKMSQILDLVPDYKKYYESYKGNYVYLCLIRHLNRIDLAGYCVRSLRSTFSNLCYGLGIREKTVGAWLGHSGKGTTSRFYINNNMIGISQDEGIQKEIELVNKWL